MKKLTLHGVALATMTVFALVSCQKEKVTISEFTATVEHCTDDNGKVMLDGNVLRWTDGDQIAVWGSDGMGTYTTSNVGEYVTTFNFTEGDDPGDPTYTAIYPASLAQRQAVILLPPVQTSTDGSLQQFPMMARSSNSELVFKNLCGALRLRLQATGKSVVGIALAYPDSYRYTSNIYLWGLFQLNYNNGEPTIGYSANGGLQVMLSITNPQDITTAKDFYISLPPNTYGAGFTIKIYTSDGSVCTKTITSGHSFRIERSGIFTITLSGNDLEFVPDAGTLNGEFSVSPTKKVRFSQGDLMYTGFGTHAVADGGMAEGTWRFAHTQYIYNINPASGNSYATQWITGFGWGTSGWNSGANNYLPYQTGGSNSDYCPGGNQENNLEGPYAYADWGVYNAILNGGNQPQQWRTLSSDEWEYLLNQRRGHAVKWGIAYIDGTQALVILPDSWNLPDGVEFNEGPAIGGTVLNRYSAYQWSLMEAAGAVCLSGYYYWSINSDNLYAAIVNIQTVQVTSGARPNGFWVRLVKDVN
jgi:hypothetical protein